MASGPAVKREVDVALVPVGPDNWRALVNLEICPDQVGLVSTNAVSLAECAARPDAIPAGIYVSGRPVGLLVRCVNDREFELHRLMIACREQGKQYGRAAVNLFLEAARAQGRPIVVRFLHWNTRAERLYRAAGFTDTGEINDEDEKVFVWQAQ
jgi:RimJ/RimL family protein N-acetyltransferase